MTSAQKDALAGVGGPAAEKREWGADVVLEDGSIAHVRRAYPEDSPLIEAFSGSLSDESLYNRFVEIVNKSEALRWLAPSPDNFVLIAERGGKVIGHAAYYRQPGGSAELGVIVLDSFQGQGLGTILLGELAEAAHSEGIGVFQAMVSPGNNKMIKVLRDIGFPTSVSIEPGLVKMTFPTSINRETVQAFDRRDATAAVAAVQKFLQPTAVAIIGASRDRNSIGGMLFRNILEAGFQGPAYPVNPRAGVVQSVSAFKSILDCPGQIDLALIVVPASAVVQVARECAQKGVKALTVISSGFAEVGKDGAALQRELVEVCRESGMRLIGPNCMGIVNTAPEVSLNAQFAPFQPIRGEIGFLSQSGALGIAVIEHANRLGLGMSTFVSVGNKADISGNDLIQYWETDPNTDLILLYLESFGNPRKFARVARRVTKKKPILAVKSGRSTAGFRATQSHTGALLAASDVTVDALFRQAGVIRIDTLGEMFDVASLLVSQPVPKGNGVAIITNAGGAGILAADAAEDLGLKVPELDPAVQAELRTFLSPEAGVKNPVDMIASATAADYAKAIRAVSADPRVDALMVLFVPPIAITPEDVAKQILSATAELNGRLPVISTFMAYHGISEVLTDGKVKVPSYPFPEVAARALARAAGYGKWLQLPDEQPPRFDDIRREEAAGLVSKCLASGAGWLPPEEAERLLRCYGIPVVRTVRAASPEEAARAAEQIGGRVVLKGVAQGLLHKTEAGAVRLNLAGAQETSEAAKMMGAALAKEGFASPAFLVQPMAQQGAEMLVGITSDPIFGPVVACGAGGTMVELMKDVSIRLTPVTERDSSEMLHELKTFQLLTGYRGAPACDVGALQEVIERVSALADDIPEVIELDLNPVIVSPSGASVVDFRVRLEERPPAVPIGAKKR